MCFFSYFFLFFSFKKLLYCCVLSTSVRYFYSSIAGEEKSAGKHLLVKMCQQQSGLTSFFSLCFWRQIQIDLFVLVYFCQFLSFFLPHSHHNNDSFIFCRFFQDYLSFFFFLLFLVGFWVIFLVFIRVFSVTITGFASF